MSSVVYGERNVLPGISWLSVGESKLFCNDAHKNGKSRLVEARFEKWWKSVAGSRKVLLNYEIVWCWLWLIHSRGSKLFSGTNFLHDFLKVPQHTVPSSLPRKQRCLCKMKYSSFFRYTLNCESSISQKEKIAGNVNKTVFLCYRNASQKGEKKSWVEKIVCEKLLFSRLFCFELQIRWCERVEYSQQLLTVLNVIRRFVISIVCESRSFGF